MYFYLIAAQNAQILDRLGLSMIDLAPILSQMFSNPKIFPSNPSTCSPPNFPIFPILLPRNITRKFPANNGLITDFPDNITKIDHIKYLSIIHL